MSARRLVLLADVLGVLACGTSPPERARLPPAVPFDPSLREHLHRAECRGEVMARSRCEDELDARLGLR